MVRYYPPITQVIAKNVLYAAVQSVLENGFPLIKLNYRVPNPINGGILSGAQVFLYSFHVDLRKFTNKKVYQGSMSSLLLSKWYAWVSLKSGQFPNPTPTYHLIHVPWGGANQDDTASGLKRELSEIVKCSYCRSGFSWKKQDRIVIEEGSWDGSDIFKPRNATDSIHGFWAIQTHC